MHRCETQLRMRREAKVLLSIEPLIIENFQFLVSLSHFFSETQTNRNPRKIRETVIGQKFGKQTS